MLKQKYLSEEVANSHSFKIKLHLPKKQSLAARFAFCRIASRYIPLFFKNLKIGVVLLFYYICIIQMEAFMV